MSGPDRLLWFANEVLDVATDPWLMGGMIVLVVLMAVAGVLDIIRMHTMMNPPPPPR